jgi:hypothetical protein
LTTVRGVGDIDGRELMLRRDERFVIDAVAAHFSGTWREGENPPDAYLTIGKGEIAVEISSLVQPVIGEDGQSVSRMSQDASALDLADSLNERLQGLFSGSRAVVLILSSPIGRRRKLQPSLERELARIAALPELPIEPVEFAAHGNVVLIHLHDQWEAGHKRVAAAVVNRRSSANILHNAIEALASRLARKASWSRATPSAQSWLVLLNLYAPLADAETYRQAMQSISIPHGFARIVLVSTGGRVDVLFEQ